MQRSDPRRTKRAAAIKLPKGPPPVGIDLELVAASAGIGCSVEEIAALLKIAPTTLYERMRKDPIIRQAIDAGREQGKATLRRLQWQGAQGGNGTMLVWLGKQLLGQRDQIDTVHDVAKPLEELLRMIAEKPA